MFLKHRWDYTLLFYNFFFAPPPTPRPCMVSLYSEASNNEEIWLLNFVLCMFLPHSGFGILFFCRSPLWASRLLQMTCWAFLVLPQCHRPLLNSSIWLPAPFGSSAVVHLILPLHQSHPHHKTLWRTLCLSQTKHSSCCSVVPQFPRIPSASDGHLFSEGVC